MPRGTRRERWSATPAGRWTPRTSSGGRERLPYTVHDAGVTRAFELADAQKAKADSAGPKTGMQRAPGGPPVQGLQPAPGGQAPGGQAPAAPRAPSPGTASPQPGKKP